MHAYLVTGDNTNIENCIQTIIKRFGFRRIDLEIKGISDSKYLLSLLKSNPISPTAYIIRQIDLATSEALNCILKGLEEPQPNTFFVLSTNSENAVIPTILSRCQLIRASNNFNIVINKNAEYFHKCLFGEKMNLITKIKKRQDAIDFCEDLIKLYYLKLKDTQNPKLYKDIQLYNQVLKNLKNNANVLLQLVYLVIFT